MVNQEATSSNATDVERLDTSEGIAEPRHQGSKPTWQTRKLRNTDLMGTESVGNNYNCLKAQIYTCKHVDELY